MPHRTGTVRSASTSEAGLLVAMVSLETTLIELPVWLSGTGVRSAVTTISGRRAADCARAALSLAQAARTAAEPASSFRINIQNPSADPPSNAMNMRQRPVSWLAGVPIRLPGRGPVA